MSLSHVVTINPAGKSFDCGPEKSVLDNALAAGVMLKHGCRDGRCGDCRTTLSSGRVVYPQGVELSENDRLGLTLLTCQARCRSDLILESPEVSEFDGISIQKLPSRVVSKEKLADDVIRLTCRIAPGSTFKYLPGQYVDLSFRGVGCRSYSMATATIEDGCLEFHVRLVPDGKVTPWIFEEIQPKQMITIEGPYGSFYLRNNEKPYNSMPAIFLASGTGFAPIKALMESLIAKNQTKPVHLYWGGRKESDLYLSELCTSWTEQYPWFRYTPVLSDEPSDSWVGCRGFVHLAVMEDYSDLSMHEVYACGAPIVIESARKDFSERCKLNLDHFYSDAFL